MIKKNYDMGATFKYDFYVSLKIIMIITSGGGRLYEWRSIDPHFFEFMYDFYII